MLWPAIRIKVQNGRYVDQEDVMRVCLHQTITNLFLSELLQRILIALTIFFRNLPFLSFCAKDPKIKNKTTRSKEGNQQRVMEISELVFVLSMGTGEKWA